MNNLNPNYPYRHLVAGNDTIIPLKNGFHTLSINFDNAATTPPLNEVLTEILKFTPWYSSIHRGTGYKSRVSNKFYEDSRKIILEFVGGDVDKDVAIYVKNTSEAINKLSNRLFTIHPEGVILCSKMEHHSNLLPWNGKYTTDYIEVDSSGRLSMLSLKEKLDKYNGRVKLVAITGASNVTGFTNPIHEIAELAHAYGAKILVDGAQMVPHGAIDMLPHYSLAHIDYLAFSAHKMYAPFGIGVLVGPKDTFMQGAPDYVGGGTVDFVSQDLVIWNSPPDKEEAGSPNVLGVVALIKSIKVLEKLGMKNIENYEKELLIYATKAMRQIPGIRLYGDDGNFKDKVSILPFDIEGIPHNITAKALSYEAGIAVRSGCFCAQPYIQSLFKMSKKQIMWYADNLKAPRPGIVRLSFAMYNTFDEIDVLIRVLNKIVRNKNYYIRKYS